ncbi:MOSC domain-containing protein YiiM [Friedmanniella endophytica]|uniref:MOSC domain-containing protein YiiM n=1 Tax=Microlunatus kandeliicorticis TaxID=1759536 RepID=A0A7W3ITZ8_9ACTN|nr:MOSC domain-containing protein [Microlunatus kandeliicorticis]MBA8795218.1 MOSC domain-containing protein YiiM [Microlunatus kandeliicorticis]
MSDALASGVLRSVHVGQPQPYRWLGREVVTSIHKHPVTGPVRLGRTNLDGDAQADPVNHGGVDKAVYAYAREDEDWWQGELGREVPDGTFGENLTTVGLDLHAAVIGEVWQLGTARLQVSQPRTPCWKLGLRMDDRHFPRRAAASRRSGALLRVLTEGVITAGQPITITARPAHGVTVAMINAIYYGDQRDLSPITDTPELADHWRAWASHRTIYHLADDESDA